MQKSDVPSHATAIGEEDIQALMEVAHGLTGSCLDLILHSPGGSLETTEAVVSYLRSQFSHIRVIVPQLAMSAATMIACAANEIAMGPYSFLGPTDPQLLLTMHLGQRLVPAQAILDQFDRAQRESADPVKLAAWLPMLGQYGPDLLEQCQSMLSLSKELVRTWLSHGIFAGQADKAETASAWLSNHKNFKSHNRHIPRDEIRRYLPVLPLEDDKHMQDLSLSIFHAATHTFVGTPAVKIIENHVGRAWTKIIQPTPVSMGDLHR